MTNPTASDVFNNPSAHWTFLTENSDDKFEGQHFDRKQAGQDGSDASNLKNQIDKLREKVICTISAYANSNKEGGLLVLGIDSKGIVKGIDHLTENQLNSLTRPSKALHHQAAEIKIYPCEDHSGNTNNICLIFVPHTTNSICETVGNHPKAWIRSGPQNLPMSQDMRDQLRNTKGVVSFENTYCCLYSSEDLAEDILIEFRENFHPESTDPFSNERLLYEAGAIIKRNGEYWFTNAGLLFFSINPQRVFPEASLRIIRFSTSYDNQNKRGLPTHDETFTGPITSQIRKARTFFRESAFFKKYQKRKPQGGFIEEPEFPSIVIDEAIVNAIAHREYQTKIQIECESYLDVFVVKNPGRMLQRNHDLPNEFSLADETLDSTPRNSKLLEWLKLMKDPDGLSYVQAISEGTKKMHEEMDKLGLPAPTYLLNINQTLIKLENNIEEREAAFLASSHTETTEFANLFPLRIRRGVKPVYAKDFNHQYKELVNTLKDALIAKSWYIDRSSYSRITAHRKGIELDAPSNIKNMVRFYPAYEFQIRSYYKHFYLCIDYKCQVQSIQKLSKLTQILPHDSLVNLRCTAKNNGWHDGKITEFDSEFAEVYFYDRDVVEQVPLDDVIPNCSISMMEDILLKSGSRFDLNMAIKKHSLASITGAARERADKILKMVRHISETIFPFVLSDVEVNLLAEPVQLIDQGKATEKTFPVHRLPEPKVVFRQHRATSDVRDGITQFGTFDIDPHVIEIIPICLHAMQSKMEELIARLKNGKYKYRGAERTFSTKFSYGSVITISKVEDTINLIKRLLEEHPDWQGNTDLNRIFLIQSPEQGYSLDDHTSPYYVVKRLLLEKGIPCQMINTPTLANPDWKDLNLALNITAKCGVTPWVLPDAIPDADFFIGLSYTQSRDGQRIMGFANVFTSYGKWEFYSGNTAYVNYEERSEYLSQLVGDTLNKLKNQLSPTPRVIFQHSAKLSREDRDSILTTARKIRPEGTFVFVYINSNHNVRLYDNRPESDGSMRRGSYIEVAYNKIYLSTTGNNPYRKSLGTPKPLEVSSMIQRPEGSPNTEPDLRVLASQVLNLTKLNWASTDSFCGEPITVKYAGDIAYLTAAFLRQSDPFELHPVLETTPWFI